MGFWRQTGYLTLNSLVSGGWYYFINNIANESHKTGEHFQGDVLQTAASVGATALAGYLGPELIPRICGEDKGMGVFGRYFYAAAAGAAFGPQAVESLSFLIDQITYHAGIGSQPAYPGIRAVLKDWSMTKAIGTIASKANINGAIGGIIGRFGIDVAPFFKKKQSPSPASS